MIKRNTIAIIYDFDGTLCPQPMQEYTVFPRLNIKPSKFWAKVKEENAKVKGEEIITYMMLLLKEANSANLKISKTDLGKMASKIKFYRGVTTFFTRINKFVADESNNSVHIRHYIISSGLKEILENTKISDFFHNIFASEYHYNQYNAPEYPKLVVTDTVKTQFLFRINKGKEGLTENVNEFMAEPNRPIPFSNIVYIGDGITDVPCMTVTNKNGGYTIAVFNPLKPRKGLKICKTLFKSAWVDYIAEADYRKGKGLDKSIKVILKTIMQGIEYRKSQIKMVRKIF